MRGSDEQTGSLFSYVNLEERVPSRHPLRKIKSVVDAALVSLDADFERLYAGEGRPSIAPERLLRAALVQVLFSIRSERQTDMSRKLMAAILGHEKVAPLLSDDHFSVDGTLVEAWASFKSFKPKTADREAAPPSDPPPPDPGNACGTGTTETAKVTETDSGRAR